MTKTAFGRPIEGEITHYTDPAPTQDNPNLFVAALDKLLAVPGVDAVRWTQYTPYFNDGDACVFGAHGASVALSWVATADEDTEIGDEYYESGDKVFYDEYDLCPYGEGETWQERHDSRKYEVGGRSTKEIHDALKEFERVLTGGSHDVILSEQFGDPACVVATTGGFQVDFYEHD